MEEKTEAYLEHCLCSKIFKGILNTAILTDTITVEMGIEKLPQVSPQVVRNYFGRLTQHNVFEKTNQGKYVSFKFKEPIYLEFVKNKLSK